jgi:hypothetical protein
MRVGVATTMPYKNDHGVCNDIGVDQEEGREVQQEEEGD